MVWIFKFSPFQHFLRASKLIANCKIERKFWILVENIMEVAGTRGFAHVIFSIHIRNLLKYVIENFQLLLLLVTEYFLPLKWIFFNSVKMSYKRKFTKFTNYISFNRLEAILMQARIKHLVRKMPHFQKES